jgi:hypothetical protein
MLIKLVGCKRYSLKGELFQIGYEYDLADDKANLLLDSKDSFGRSYFEVIRTPARPVEIIEESEIREAGVTIKRTRGRPKKNPEVRTAGDSSNLEDEVSAPRKPESSVAEIELT